MIKFWFLKNNKNIDVVLVNENSIYIGKLKEEGLNNFKRQIEQNKIPENLFSIPFSYIKSIENQKGKNEIKIHFGKDSEEEIISKDQEIKNEIFNCLKEVIPNLNYSKKLPSLIKYSKAPLFAVLFTTIIFLWALYYAIQLENGVEYELKGTAGLTAIIFSIGLLGVTKVILLYCLLVGIAIYSLIRKNKSRSEIEKLNR